LRAESARFILVIAAAAVAAAAPAVFPILFAGAALVVEIIARAGAVRGIAANAEAAAAELPRSSKDDSCCRFQDEPRSSF